MRPLRRGFIALITVILVSAVLLIATVSQGAAGLSARQNMLLLEYKERSASLADACAQWVRLRLYYDPEYPAQYAMPDVAAVGSGRCSVLYCMSEQGSARTCAVEGEYQHAFTDALVTIADPLEPSIAAYREVPSP